MPAIPITNTPIHFHTFLVTRQVFHLTPLSFALVNLKPLLPGHVLISPRRNVPRISDLTPAEVTDLFLTVQKVSRTIERVYGASALNVAIQDGVDAGQSVPHVHAHVIPRKRGDVESNDEIYEMMDSEEGDIGSALKERDVGDGKRERRGAKWTPDADRKPRSDEEMEQEAQMLAEEMAKDAIDT